MRVLHFDCFNGISGDMTLGALVDLGLPPEQLLNAIGSLNLPIQIEMERVKRCGFAATKVNIIAQDEENYRFLPDVEAILDRANVTPTARELAKRIFRKLAEAEAASHGLPLEKVHFHEVGALDSIADVLGAAVGLDHFQPQFITSSPVPTGTGTVKGAHGLMPIPAPGTAALLKGIPIAPSDVKFELTTPTGAAILATVVNEFTPSLNMTITAQGSGAGTKDFLDRPNILRLFLGESQPSPSQAESDHVIILETNLDDCSGEIIGHTVHELFQAGALDVFTQSIQMKKQRPGVLLTAITTPDKVETLQQIIFRETGTFGIRQTLAERRKLQREMITVPTPWGTVAAKRGFLANGFEIITPEYEECARVAREHNLPLRQVYDTIRAACVVRANGTAP